MSKASSPSPPIGASAIAAAPPPAAAPPATPPPAAATRPPSTIADVLHAHKHRVDGWTPVKVAAFIIKLGETGSVTQAAAYVRMSTASCYSLKHRPGGEPFAEAWETAIAAKHEMLAEIALDRVREGVERIRWYRGSMVGYDRIFSDRLLLSLLAASDPERRRAEAATRAAALVAARGAIGGPGADATSGPAAIPPSDLAGLNDYVGDDAVSEAVAAFDPDEEGRLSPEDEAMTLAFVARIEARKAATEAQIAAIGAGLDAALGRKPRVYDDE